MPVRRGHVAPKTTLIETIIRKFDTHSKYLHTEAVVYYCNQLNYYWEYRLYYHSPLLLWYGYLVFNGQGEGLLLKYKYPTKPNLIHSLLCEGIGIGSGEARKINKNVNI